MSRRVLVTGTLALWLGGCAVGSLGGRSDAASGEPLQESFRTQAAEVSESTWSKVRASGSAMSQWATILVQGRDAAAASAPAADSSSASPASYLAAKAEAFNTHEQQLSSIIDDVEEKTAEVDAFIGYAEALSDDYRARLGELSAMPASEEVERQRAAIEADRKLLEQAVADLKEQRANYEAVERELSAARPDLDTSALSRALDRLGDRINTLVKLARSMGAKALGR